MKAWLLSTGLALACIVHTPASAAPAVSNFEQAQQQLERGNYADAHRRFALLADCGHRESARIALQMRQHGPQLYGMNFTVGPKQLARWRALLAAPVAGPATASSTASSAGSGEPACLLPEPSEPHPTHEEHWRHQGVG